MPGTTKNKLNKIWEKIERDNKEIHTHNDVMDKFSESLPLRVKNRVVSTLERATNLGLEPKLESYENCTIKFSGQRYPRAN